VILKIILNQRTKDKPFDLTHCATPRGRVMVDQNKKEKITGAITLGG
jgi:hypothetical protein